MLKKLDYKNTLFQLAVGLIAYYVFLRNENPLKKKPILIVGQVTGEGFQYDSIYFKNSEYFKSFPIPEKYEKNWWKLSKFLDQIRISFGSAILITKGYELDNSGYATNTFQTCQSVEIYPQNKEIKKLHQTILDLEKSGVMKLSENILVSVNYIKISINV